MKMKSLLVMVAGALFLYSCKKSNSGCVTNYGNPSATEVTMVRNYVATAGIAATEDPRGFFYHISFAGTGTESPVLTDSITVKYRGALTSGQVFDSTATGETRKFPLNRLITGWQVGLPLLKRNGIIDLYLPPSHAYGCQGQYPIPGNAITIFRVELVDF